MSVSVAREVEGVLPRGAKSVSVVHEVEVDGVLRRIAKRASVARDAESVSDAHEVEGVLCHDVENFPVAYEEPKRSASRRTEMGRMTSASRPPETRHPAWYGVLPRDAKSVPVARDAKSVSAAHAKSVSVAHDVEGVLHRDAESASAARDAKSVSVAHEVEVACDAKSASAAREVEGVLCRGATGALAAHEVERVLPRVVTSASVARSAKSASAVQELEGVLRRDAKSVSVAPNPNITDAFAHSKSNLDVPCGAVEGCSVSTEFEAPDADDCNGPDGQGVLIWRAHDPIRRDIARRVRDALEEAERAGSNCLEGCGLLWTFHFCHAICLSLPVHVHLRHPVVAEVVVQSLTQVLVCQIASIRKHLWVCPDQTASFWEAARGVAVAFVDGVHEHFPFILEQAWLREHGGHELEESGGSEPVA
jgi:hypothetical protein